MSQTRSLLGSTAQRVAQALVHELEGPSLALIATPDGFALGHAGTRDVDPARLAALVSSMAALGDAASRETGIGDARSLVVDSHQGRLALRCLQAGTESVIVVMLTDTRVLLGRVLNLLGDAERLMNA